jgi:hypothetical protein
VPDPRQIQRGSTFALSGAMLVIGIVLIVLTLARGGGPLATGLLVGVLFVCAGAGRLYVERRRP